MGPATPTGGSVVFLGTSDFAVPSLEALVAAGEAVSLVVTQPDRRRGRGRRPEPPAVSQAAQRLELPLFQPENLNASEAVAGLARVRPEFLTVVAYGQLLKRPVLNIAAGGTVNLHPSLLPRHRGPSPIAWAILGGDDRIGNSTMFLDEGLDSGPLLLQSSFPLRPEATRGELEEELSQDGARLLVETLEVLRQGRAEPRPQDFSAATMSRLLTREMRQIDWTRPAPGVRRLVHALSPRPSAAVRVRGRLVKILRVGVVKEDGEPGRVLENAVAGPVVGCGQAAIVLIDVQPAGKRPMSGADLARGGGMRPGDVLESPWGQEEAPDG
jgi:methionyl-tRNA formyltransferase